MSQCSFVLNDMRITTDIIILICIRYFETVILSACINKYCNSLLQYGCLTIGTAMDRWSRWLISNKDITTYSVNHVCDWVSVWSCSPGGFGLKIHNAIQVNIDDHNRTDARGHKWCRDQDVLVFLLVTGIICLWMRWSSRHNSPVNFLLEDGHW